MTDNTLLEQFKADLTAHGELHLTVADVSGEVEARAGVTSFDFDAGLVHIDDGQTTHTIVVDHISSWYRPMSVTHD